MFGSELAAVSLGIYALQVLIFPANLLSYLSRKFDGTRERFLWLSLHFILYNSVWALPSLFLIQESHYLNEMTNLIGILIIFHLYKYFHKELVITLNKKRFNYVLIGVTIFELLRFIISDTILGLQIADLPFFLIYQLVVIYLFLPVALEIYRVQSKSVNPVVLVSFLVICVILISPSVIFGLEVSFLRMFLINIVYLAILLAYIRHYFVQVKVENKLISDSSYYFNLTLSERYLCRPDLFEEFGLTERELEIAKLLAEGLSYREIAELIFLEPGTIRTHAFNIFSKTGIEGNKKLLKFRDRFGSFPNHDK